MVYLLFGLSFSEIIIVLLVLILKLSVLVALFYAAIKLYKYFNENKMI